MTTVRRGRRFGRLVSLPALVGSLRPRQLVTLWLAIFFTFATLGVVLDLFSHGRQPVIQIVLNGVAVGALSVAYAHAAMPFRLGPFLATMVAHAALISLQPRLFHLLPSMPPRRLTVDGTGTIVCVSLGYSFSLRFIDATATRYLRVRVEMDLARDIHQVLVPPVQRVIGDYEFFGWSHASGDVGGDLVDVVDADNGWIGYVADVSGHGVGPGVVMGGLIEVFDRNRRELGFEWAKRVLRETGEQPLAAIAERLLSEARAHGQQLDDQTILLIRHL